MEPEQRIQTYEEFWKYYVGEHSKRSTRVLHFIGTCGVIGVILLSIFISPWLLLLMPICGYAFAWIGHFGFEKNKPATFKYPFWSLISDFRMFGYTLIGKMGREAEKYGKR